MISQTKNTESAIKETNGKNNTTQIADNNTQPDINADSRYFIYSKSNLDNSESKRRVLFFYASWCPICRPADADFHKNMDMIPEDIAVIRVNYNDPETDDEEKELARKYGVTYQHTFVQIDSQGKEITKWVGGQTSELLKNVK